MNKVILTGRIGRELSVKEAGQSKVAKSVLAVDDGYGENKKTHWINFEAWGKLSDVLEKYTTKGSKILIEGKVATNSYETKDGSKRTDTFVRVDQLELLDNKPQSVRTAEEVFGKELVSVIDEADIPF